MEFHEFLNEFQELIDAKQDEIALKCLQKCVVPILDKESYFERLNYPLQDERLDLVLAISETLLMFKRTYFESYLDKLVQMAAAVRLSSDKLAVLVKNCSHCLPLKFPLNKNSHLRQVNLNGTQLYTFCLGLSKFASPI